VSSSMHVWYRRFARPSLLGGRLAVGCVSLLLLARPVLAQEAHDQHDAPEAGSPAPFAATVRGFGDISFLRREDGSTQFALGQLDGFITATIAEHVNVLTEVVVEADDRNAFGVDVERLLIQFVINDYLRVAAGRYHTSLGYYNTAYHHGLWFQTAASRPLLMAFEDDGGLLPAHQVGVSATGQIPLRDAGLHWVAEVGNGRPRANTEPVLNVHDPDRHKAVNVGLISRPGSWTGTQFGVSYFHDRFDFTPDHPIGENILTVHAVFDRPAFQWLNEFARIHDSDDFGLDATTTAWYSQIGKRFGLVTPFARFQYTKAPQRDPIYADIGFRRVTSLGIRYDVATHAALKFQYDYDVRARGEHLHALTGQVAFVF
jgi:hypothetical protein